MSAGPLVSPDRERRAMAMFLRLFGDSTASGPRAARAATLKPATLKHEQLEGRYALSGVPAASVGLVGPIAIQPVAGPVTTLPVPSAPTVTVGAMAEDTAFQVTKARLAECARGVVTGVTDVRNVRLVAGFGRLAAVSNCAWTYRPALDWFGDARISYDLVTARGVRSLVGIVRVLPVNDAPVSGGPVSLGTMSEDGALRITPQQLLARSFDVDGDRLTISNLVLSNGQGQLRPQQDGSWIFQPSRDWNGDARFSYTVSDGRIRVSTSATLVVSAVNDKPEASAQAHLGAMANGAEVQLTATRLLSGARDVDGDRLSVRNLRMTSGRGSLSANSDGTWTLVAAAESTGPLTLAYDVSDGQMVTGVMVTMVVSAASVGGTSPVGDTTITVPAGSHIAYGPGAITLQSYPGNSLRYTNFPGSEMGLPSPMRIYVDGRYRALVAFVGTHTGGAFTFVDDGKVYSGVFPDVWDVYF